MTSHKESKHPSLYAAYVYLFTSFFCIPLNALKAQYTNKVHLTKTEGLASNTVYDLFQDDRGFVWIATDKGVTRYDSYSMRTYSIKDGLADNDILSIHQDQRGRVWFLSYSGKHSYYWNNKIHNAENDSLLCKIPYEWLSTSFLEDSSGNLWISDYYKGINRINSSDGSVKSYPFNGCNYIFEDRHQKIHFIRDKGAFRLEKGVFRLVKQFEKKRFKSRFYYVENKHALFSTISNRLYATFLENDKKNWFIDLPGVSSVNKLTFFDDQWLYVATDDGVHSVHVHEQKRGKRLLKGKKVSDVLVDSEQNMWIATLFDGVFLLKNRSVLNYPTSAKYTILPLKDVILFGGAGGEVHSIKGTQINSLNIQYINNRLWSKQGIINEMVLDQKNQVWMGTSHGLFRLDKNIAHLNYFHVVNALLYQSGYLYIGTKDYLLKMDDIALESNFGYYKKYQGQFNFVQLNNELRKKHQIFDQFVGCLNGVVYEQLFVGTKNGVVVIEDSVLGVHPQFDNNKVVGVEKSSNADLWVLSKTEGLYFYDDERKHKVYVPLSTEKHVTYNCLTLDETEGIAWVGSDRGLFMVKRTENEFEAKHFGAMQGIANEEIHDIAIINDSIWLATSGGVTLLPKMEINDTSFVKLYIDSICVKNRTYDVRSVPELKAHENEVVVHFTAISFREQEKVKFHCTLNGKLLKEASVNNRKVKLANLPPAKYTLNITVLDGQGVRRVTQQIRFHIKPIWWKPQALWFLAAVILLAFFFYRTSIKKKKLKYTQNKPEQNRYLLVKSVLNGEVVRIFLDDLQYVQATKDYMLLFQDDHKVLIRSTLKDLEEKLSSHTEFLRIHRSYIVNMNKVGSYTSSSLTISKVQLPIGKTYRLLVKEYWEEMNRRVG